MSLTALKSQRGRYRASITSAFNFSNEVNDATPSAELEVRISNLNEAWKQLNLIENQISGFEESTEDENAVSSFTHYEEKYIQALARITTHLREKQETASRQQTPQTVNELQLGWQNLVLQHNDVVLPKMTVPTFSGEYSAWKTFSDIFKGAVDSKASLSNTQKFYYLSSFLGGEAADLIKNIPVTNETYTEAWNKLQQRYDRPHLVARSFIKGFMKLPTTTTTNPKILRKNIDGADECLRGLSAVNIKERDPWLIFILLNKLDAETRHNWFEHVGSRTSITVEEFLKFLDARFIHLESNELHTTGVAVRNTSIRSHVTAAISGSSCALCNGQHNIAKCTDFIAASISDRRKQVRSKSICFNCLKAGHRVKDCKSNFSCRTCHAKHHTLLHESTDKESKSDLGKNSSHTNGNNVSLQSTQDDALASHHVLQGMHSMQVVLPTAMVLVKDDSEHIHKLRALIDTGSQVSFISETCVQRIGVSRSKARLHIKGISSSEAGMTKGCVNLVISSQLDNSNVSVCAYILQRITADIPKHSISNIPWKRISSLKLADSNFNQSAPIDLLLGADIAWNIITDGKIQIEKPNLFAINSIFGWILSGQVDVMTREDAISSYTATINVDKLLTRFWELDECKPVSKQSNHDDPAEIHFRETHTRSTDGKYVVELPFKGKDLTFTNTLQGAVQRLNSMERRFHNNKQLKQEYAKFMNEYMTLGHMHQIPLEDIDNSPHYYLPHHAILKPESSTTKLRVVFDGSHQDAVGKSLNDQLLVGPPIQRDLFGVSLRFRQFKYVFVADITKMFRQIWVSPIHQDYQRIVWRESPDDPIKHYRLCTVTYGTASAPFLSVRVLQQLAMDNINKFPHAANIISNNIYVDDVMAGGDSIDAVINLKTELVNLLESGGFHLRKWSSNSTAVLQTVPAEDCEAFSKHKNGGSDYIKILGLYWNPKPDKYSFHVGTPTEINATKRHILSEIARIFDIFGFLAPVVVKIKILFQEIWLTNMSWDDPLPARISSTWRHIRETLHLLEAISIPRNILNPAKQFELHCFCDASTSAYAAVVYSVGTKEGIRSSSMVAAKTRVAPLKAMSIPRLELCAALLLTRLYNSIKVSLNIANVTVYAWTDSQVVLHWLSSPSRNWKMFIGNRTEEILDCLSRSNWNYIDTKENPADCASRGLTPEQLLQHKLWWTGPNWLRKPKSFWPIHTPLEGCELPNDILEQRKTVLHTITSEGESSILIDYAHKVSSFQRLINVIAYVLRFISQLRHNRNIHAIHLEHKELQNARYALFRAIQQESFEDTFRWLKTNSRS